MTSATFYNQRTGEPVKIIHSDGPVCVCGEDHRYVPRRGRGLVSLPAIRGARPGWHYLLCDCGHEGKSHNDTGTKCHRCPCKEFRNDD